MPVVKKRNEQTETRLLLESSEPVELPAAEIADRDVLVQFDQFKRFVPELLKELRDGTTAQPVAVMNDGSTFAIHGETRTFWVKLWHAAGSEMTKIDRAQIISCLPSTQGMTVIVEDFGGQDYEEDAGDQDHEEDAADRDYEQESEE